jgi:exodeoxyribonuclease VII small subunit
MGFEKDMARLEAITKALQDSNTSLDESITLFEEGVTLAKNIEKNLTEIERKVHILLSDPHDTEAEAILAPFTEETP